METTVFQIAGYSDRSAVVSAVEAALRRHPICSRWSPSRLRHVVIKPNWVQESHEYRSDLWEPVITHPSVLAAVVQAVAQSLGGVGTISICDAPHTYANFNAIIRRGRFDESLDDFRSNWPQLNIELIDLRREIWIRKDEVVVERRPNEPDPRGYVAVNLRRNGLFFGHPGEGRYYGADYDSAVVRKHHVGDVQEYLLAGTPVICDFFVNVPKLKTHKKTGVTCCLKNLVGINGDKNWLPHHTEGSPSTGGDEYPDLTLSARIETALKLQARKLALVSPKMGGWIFRKARGAGKAVLGDSETTIRNGNWYGNDTCWRMALDLNRALLFADASGELRGSDKPKPYLGIIDGIVGGEGNGPICPDPVQSGVLIAGDNPAELDATACRLMGFDPMLVPLVREAFDLEHPLPVATRPFADVTVRDERLGRSIPLTEVRPCVPGGFRPHFGWVGHIEADVAK